MEDEVDFLPADKRKSFLRDDSITLMIVSLMTFVIRIEKAMKGSLLGDPAQLTFTCPKSTIGKVEKTVKYVQI